MIAELRINSVLPRAQRHHQGVVEEMALHHGSDRLDDQLGVKSAATFVCCRESHRGGLGVPDRRQRARRGASPHEIVSAVVVKFRRGVVNVVAVIVADIVPVKTIGNDLVRRGPRR